MSDFRINGGNRLFGSVRVHGSKNSVLPILAACVLNRNECVIHNCPHIRDVDSAVAIMEHLGCTVRREQSTLSVDARHVYNSEIPDALMREMRSSVIFLGAILTRCKSATLSFPGGCELGPRPIDLHLSALRQLGAGIKELGGRLECNAEKLRGADIVLSFPSVGATENIMLAACGASGRTRIINAAREPEIEDLQNFLRAMGCRVCGAGSSTVEIHGVSGLNAAEHTVIPDRVVAATYMCAVACAGGEVLVESIVPEHIETVKSLLESAGCSIKMGNDYALVSRTHRLDAIRSVRTMPYPGFPTDAAPPLMAVSCLCDGTTVFIENIFENRYRHVSELVRMGADIKTEGRVALVYGASALDGAAVTATDLRGGAALVIAALGARGESTITGGFHIERGYETLGENLAKLGADIKIIE